MEVLKAELVDDGKRDKVGRRLMPLERIDALVREFRGSGLTLAAFARRAGIKYPTFAGWVYKYQAKANGKGSVRFAQFQLPPAAAPVPVELSVTLPCGTTIRGADAASVAALVRALRS